MIPVSFTLVNTEMRRSIGTTRTSKGPRPSFRGPKRSLKKFCFLGDNRNTNSVWGTNSFPQQELYGTSRSRRPLFCAQTSRAGNTKPDARCSELSRKVGLRFEDGHNVHAADPASLRPGDPTLQSDLWGPVTALNREMSDLGNTVCVRRFRRTGP